MVSYIVKRKIIPKPHEKRGVLYIPLKWVSEKDVLLFKFDDDTIFIVPASKISSYISLIKKEKTAVGGEGE